MQLFYDDSILIVEKGEDYYIYSPINHNRVSVNEYAKYLIELLLQEKGKVEPAVISSAFMTKYQVELSLDEIKKQINRLVEMELFFYSRTDLQQSRRRVLEKFQIKDKMPKLAYLLLTYRCNFQCFYCYLRDTGKDVQELNTQEWRKAIQILKDQGVERLAITGGEPLMRQDLVEILQACKSDNIQVALLTNGSLLPQRIEAIDPYVDQIIISLDSFDPQVNSQTRSQVGFEQILASLEYYARKNPDKIQVRAVITKYNVDQLDEYTERLHNKYGVKTIKTLVNPIRPEEVEMVPDMSERMTIDEDRIDSLKFGMKYRKCGACYEVMALNPAGDLYPCQALMNPEFKMANIFDSDWFNQFLHSQVRKSFTELNLDKIEKCRDCAYRYLCGGCCPAIAYNVYGSLDHHVPFFCDYLKERAKNTLTLSEGIWQEY